MIQELNTLEKFIFDANGGGLVNIEEDEECRDYAGYNFQIGSHHVKFRKAKLTPKKIGQFVTLWKRNLTGQTVPFDMEDEFNYYIIMASDAHRKGLFVFPKEILVSMGILSSFNSAGKRGFRIYPEWDIPVSSQSLSTKKWQNKYFIDLNKVQETREQLQLLLQQTSIP